MIKLTYSSSPNRKLDNVYGTVIYTGDREVGVETEINKI